MSRESLKPPRHWLLYALLGTVLAVVLCCSGLVGSYQVWRSRLQARQRRAVLAVEALGGEVSHAVSSLNPVIIQLESGDAANIFLLGGKKLGDDDLRAIAEGPLTRGLFLSHNNLTDAGLAHLAGLRQLETLDLKHNYAITDAGLVHLEGLTNLQQLILIRTQVTPAGVAKLQQKLPRTKIAY